MVRSFTSYNSEETNSDSRTSKTLGTKYLKEEPEHLSL
jgi:hypothetical protein